MWKYLKFMGVFPLFASAAFASDVKTLSLVPDNDPPIPVAQVTIEADGSYAIVWDDAKFGDFFLSMRPFKCLEGTEKLWCRVDYPYDINRKITPADLTDLEYDLLFVWKNASDYGIDMWNGVYYRLDPTETGFSGKMHEIDMDVLAAPPEDGSLRPITVDMLDESDPDSHWLPRLVIQ